ncbi:putative ankyrin repeat protein [Phytophthora citrophthora]|uniref:Ankyrin repeat protein n=1 Tax=Phytophthora citrophthora TaxID=4793 RepID=A0AAD9GX96_9STRA|nr:putative ankyrin repeat protein [Phytophthora citrophthora]
MLPAFSAATFVFRSRPAFDGLPHVVDTVSVFLDSSVDLSLFNACKTGSVRLLDRIWNSSQVFVDGSSHPGTKWTLQRFLRTDKHYQQYLFTKCLEYAVPRQDLDVIKWLSSKFQGFTVTFEVVARACKAGSMDVLRFFYENDSRFLEERGEIGRGHPTEWGGLSMSAAVLSHRSDIVWWLHGHIPDADYNWGTALNSALMRGNIILVEWMEAQGVRSEVTRVALRSIVASGRLDVLQWLERRGQLPSAIRLLGMAAEKGHLDIVQWIINHSLESHAEDQHRIRVVGPAALSIHAAATNGNLKIAKYLRQFVVEQSEDEPPVLFPVERTENQDRIRSPEFERVTGMTMVLAVKNDFLDVVKWLIEEYGDDPSMNIFEHSGFSTVVDTAAEHGQFDVLKYFHELQIAGETRLYCTKNAMDKAAANGHLDIVHWLHDNYMEGCSTAAMDEAAGNGHLDVVKWLHRHRAEGCTQAAMDKAAMYGHLDVVQWLHANRSEGCTTRAMDEAAMTGRLDMVKWLHANRSEGCTQFAMDEAAIHGHLDVVKWLHSNRTEGCSVRAMSEASENGHLKVVQWLYANRSEGCTSDTMDYAATFGHFEMVLFLHYQCRKNCSEEALLEAQENNNPEVAAWVLEHFPGLREVVE